MKTLSARVMKTVQVPRGISPKYYWVEKVIPIMNKKFIDMRSNDRGVCHKQFKSMTIYAIIYFVAVFFSYFYSNLIVVLNHFLYLHKVDYPNGRPDTNKLAQGPIAFGCLEKTVEEDSGDVAQDATHLFDFIGNYVGKTYGVNAINKWVKENKGMSFLHKMTVDDLVHCITMVKNHEDSWECGIVISQLKDPRELDKYENYKDLIEPQEREKYAPKTPRYSVGRGVKRGFGAVMWDDEGREFYKKTKTTWSYSFGGRAAWLWLIDGWNTWVVRNTFGWHWKKIRNKNGNRSDQNENDEDVDDDGSVGEIDLPGDGDFYDCKKRTWREGDGESIDGDIGGQH